MLGLEIFYSPDRLETCFLLARKSEKIANLVCDLVNFMLQRPKDFLNLLKVYEKTKLAWVEQFLFFAQTANTKGLTNFLRRIEKSTSKNFSYQILLHNLEDMTLLQWSSFFDKRNFSAILAIIANTPERDIWLASQLARRKPETGKVGLQIFWKTSGKQHLPAFLAIIEKSNHEVSVAYLVTALKSSIKNDQSVLGYLLSDSDFSVNHLKLLLKIISKSEHQSALFFEWLTSPNKSGWMPLQIFLSKNPSYLIPFLEEAEKNSNIAHYTVLSLGKPSPNGWTIWDIIEDPDRVLFSEQELEKISNLLSALANNEKKVIKASYSPFWQSSSLTSKKCDANTRYIDLSKNWTLMPELKI